MDGRAYLERLIAEQIDLAAEMQAGRPISAPLGVGELSGVAHGLVAAGALTPSDAEEVLDNLRAMITARGKRVTRTFSSSTTTAPAGRHQGLAATEAAQGDGPDAPTPLGLISIVGHTLIVRNTEFLLVSLELWSSFFTLRFAINGVTWVSRPTPMWLASDDTGTVYQQSQGGHQECGHLITAEQRFEPALSPAARSLHLQIRVGAEMAAADLNLKRLPTAPPPST